MSMSERVAHLRQQSLDAIPTISTERAELMTKFYRQNIGLVSAPVHRALAFQYLMENKTICINEGELIVRVAGYSDYFCDLGKSLQDEIIARTEHQSF